MTDITSKSIEDLLKAVNDASGSARALFVTLMVLALYFLIVVSGTDDMALLRNATVAVPTLSNATLPARAFYICAPLVFVFLHLDLLIHLKLLSDKLLRFNQLLETSGLDEQAVRDYRLRLAGFPFSNWLGSDPRTGRRVHALQGAMVWLTLVLLPLTVLMAMQLGFLAYQSEAVTWLHRAALIVDAGLLLHFWVAFRYGRYRPADASPGFLFTEADKAWRRQVQRFRRWRVDTFYARTRYWHDVAGDRRRVVRMVRRTLPVLRLGLTAIGAPLAVALLLATVFGLWAGGHVVLSIALAFLCLIFGSRASTLLSSFILALRQSAGDIAHGAWTFVMRRWPVLMPAAPLLLLSVTVATIPDEAADRASRWLYGWMEGSTQDEPSPDGGLVSFDFQRQIDIVSASLSEDDQSTDTESLEKFEGARCARWLAAAMPGMPDAKDRLPGMARQASAPSADKAGPPEAEREGSALAFHLENANRMPQEMRASCPTIALFHLKGGWFRRTLTVTGKVVARSDIRPELAKDLRASLREYRARAKTGEHPDAELANRYDDLVAQIEGLNLSERNLRWANFTDAAFPKAVLDRAQLQHAILRSSDLRKVNLERAWLTGADMRGATLTGAIMIEATLTGAYMSLTTLTGAIMIEATLTGANMSRTTLTGAIMIEATLTGADMSGATLTGADMSGATLTGAKMIGATLTGADMSGATLTGADMSGATLTGADMSCFSSSRDIRCVTLTGAYMRGATLTGADMSGATLTGADMNGARLTGANMWRASARGTVFPNATVFRRGIFIVGLETGRYSERDIKSTLAELARASTVGKYASRRALFLARDWLRRRINQDTLPDRFTDCIGGAPCGDDDTGQRQSALDRAAHFEALICPPDTRGKNAGAEDSASTAKALVQRLRHDTVLGQSKSDNRDKTASEYRALEYVRFAAEDTLRRIATRRCVPPEAQALIDDWARKNPPPAKEPLP